MFNRQPSQNGNTNPLLTSPTHESAFNSLNNNNKNNENQLITSRQNNTPIVVVKSNSVRINFSNQNLSRLNVNSPNFSSPNSLNHKNYTPSPNVKQKLSERFIPCRGTNLIDRFEMAKILQNKDEDEDKSNEENQDNQTGIESTSSQSNKNYTNLLKKNLFGDENTIFTEENSTNYLSTNINNTNSNIYSKLFKYKTDEKKKDTSSFGLNTQLYSLINNYKNISNEPERKFSKIPFKILDAPGLMDDFYLNLVDWSNDNNLVVGLHNSVFIWSANKSRVQKLTEYGDENYVSSVSWNPK